VAGGDQAAELALVVPVEEDELGAGDRAISFKLEAADPVARERLARHVVHVEKRTLGKRGVDGHAEEPALPESVDRDGQHGLIDEAVALDEAERAGLLAHENPAVGRGAHRRGAGQP
jgi:hypothetical protein